MHQNIKNKTIEKKINGSVFKASCKEIPFIS